MSKLQMLRHGVWMVLFLMIKESIDEIFNAIKNSNTYKEYISITSVLKKDKEVNKLVDEIKKLQKKSVNLEYKGDNRYKEVDKEIDEKVKILNNIPIYKEYLRRMDKLNDSLSRSSYTIEKYINEKI